MKFTQKAFYIILLLIVGTLPFSTLYNSYLIGLLGLNWLVQIIVFKKAIKYTFTRAHIFFILFYLLHLVGLAYTPSENLIVANFNLEIKFSFLLMPLIFSTDKSRLSQKQVKTVLTTFLFSCLLATIVCLIHAISQNFKLNNFAQVVPDLFTNQKLSKVLDLHASYFALYLTFCIGIIVYLLLTYKETFTKVTKGLTWLAIAYFLMIIALLGTRMIILSFIFISTLLTLIYAHSQKKLLLGGLITSGVFLFVTLIFLSNSENLDRLKKTINYQGKYTKDGHYAHGGISLRFNIWDCAVNIIKEKPLFGHGTGEAQKRLNKCYHDNNYWAVYYWMDSGKGPEFNAHNSYLQNTLALGIVGLILLVGLIINLIVIGFKQKNYLLLYFLFLTIGLSMTEAIFKTQKGTVFFVLFSFIFIINQYNNTSSFSLNSDKN